MEGINLTDAQHAFLRGYLGCLDCSVLGMLQREDVSGFVNSVKESDFDDGEETPAAARRVAKKLSALDVFSEMDIHHDRAGGQHLYVVFSEKGAKMLYLVGREAVSIQGVLGTVQ